MPKATKPQTGGTIHLVEVPKNGAQSCVRCGKIITPAGKDPFVPQAILEQPDGTFRIWVSDDASAGAVECEATLGTGSGA